MTSLSQVAEVPLTPAATPALVIRDSIPQRPYDSSKRPTRVRPGQYIIGGHGEPRQRTLGKDGQDATPRTPKIALVVT